MDIEGLSPLVEIRESPIHGLGLFASCEIKANQKICFYVGTIMTYRQFISKYSDFKYTCFSGARNQIVVAKEKRNAITYVNSSENPNCMMSRYWLISTRDIRVGEELTLKYHSKYNTIVKEGK